MYIIVLWKISILISQYIQYLVYTLKVFITHLCTLSIKDCKLTVESSICSEPMFVDFVNTTWSQIFILAKWFHGNWKPLLILIYRVHRLHKLASNKVVFH